jgi:ABC-type multidrug transport system fused ATPase/permease subunit
MDSIRKVAQRKTIIMVTHWITSVKNCDMIYVMENGTIAAQGTYSQLMQSTEAFRTLARTTASATARIPEE